MQENAEINSDGIIQNTASLRYSTSFTTEETLRYMQGYGVGVKYYYEEGVKKRKVFWTSGLIAKKEIEKIISLLELSPGAKVLDLGCGHGRFVYQTAICETFSVGVDLSFDRISALSKYFNKDSFPPGKSYFQLADCEKLPFPDSCFDRIICYDLLEHLTEAQKILAIDEAYRVLKRGGIAVFATDNLNYYLATLPVRKLLALFKFKNPFKVGIPLTPGQEDFSGHIGLISPGELLKLIKRRFNMAKVFYSRNRRLDKIFPFLNKFICEDFPVTNFLTAAHYAIKCRKVEGHG